MMIAPRIKDPIFMPGRQDIDSDDFDPAESIMPTNDTDLSKFDVNELFRTPNLQSKEAKEVEETRTIHSIQALADHIHSKRLDTRQSVYGDGNCFFSAALLYVDVSYQRIQQLKTQGTDANDLLPLAVTNFNRRRVKIFCSRKACPISDIISNMEQLSIFNPIYLTLFVPTGQPEHYDGLMDEFVLRRMLDPIGFQRRRRLLMDHHMFNQQILKQL